MSAYLVVGVLASSGGVPLAAHPAQKQGDTRRGGGQGAATRGEPQKIRNESAKKPQIHGGDERSTSS